ncbi:MAG: serine/threonine-protein phosphatase [Leptolyngbya sp. SIOISBB]|nr:serine/threonine-protein phosphatase [Leptolyngbya sp. SIOISBB]
MPNSQLPLVHRYLWAQGDVDAPLPAGSYLAQRYRVIQFPLLLDTQPQLAPPPLPAVPKAALPYLALSPYLMAIPRPFTQVLHPDGQTPLLLLEEVPLQGQPHSDTAPVLLPTLLKAWPQAAAIVQLTWLWQVAQLWQPCLDQQVAHCLLDQQLVRVDGEDVRFLSLSVSQVPPALSDLGQHWQGLVATAARPIREYLTQLTQQLMAGQGHIGGLIHSLAQALEQQAAQCPMQVQLAAYSDQGPTRQRNEDACFPPSGTAQAMGLQAETDHQLTPAPLLVVCDGVGGHEGGDVASYSAIAEVTQALQPWLVRNDAAHPEIVQALKEALLTANQVITERNDADHRRERGRMGTTIVLALVHRGRLYVAHLGDSRAYRVRSHNCRQLTLDDDVAVRDMRLGLELYSEALRHPGSGALVQALGMAATSHLHPTVQLFSIAADSLILLCSDGLSDHDLVDQLWSSELLPVLQGDRDVAKAAQQLITLANTHNGHDNVTVGLLRLSPQSVLAIAPVPVQFVAALHRAVPDVTARPVTAPAVMPTPTTVRSSSVPSGKSRGWPLVMTSVLVAGLIGIVGALGWQWWQRRAATTINASDNPEGTVLSPSAPPPATEEPSIDSLSVGDYRLVNQLSDPTATAILITTTSPPTTAPPNAVDLPKRLLSAQSVVQVVSRQQIPDGQLWVRLQVCSAATPSPAQAVDESASSPSAVTDTTSNLPLPPALPGDQGWLLQSDVSTLTSPLLDTSIPQQGLCID